MAAIVRNGEGAVLDLPGRSAAEIMAAANGARAMTLRIVEIDPGPSGRGPHVHDGFEEAIHVLEGEGLLRTDAGEHKMRAGDTALVPAGERHATYNTGSGPLRLFCAFPVNDIRPGTREFASWDAER